jgi:hypothetical protein
VVVVTCPISELFCVWVERVGEMLEHGFNAEGENIAQSIKNRFLTPPHHYPFRTFGDAFSEDRIWLKLTSSRHTQFSRPL